MGRKLLRRAFFADLMVCATAWAQSTKPKRPVRAPMLGVCSTSYALKDPAPEALIQSIRANNLKVVSLGVPHFDPWGSATMAGMRAARAKFADAGILLRSVSVDIAPSRTDAEISKILSLASALDVRHVTARVDASMLGRVNELARRHSMIVAILNGADDLNSTTALQNAIHSFGALGVALDLPRFEAAGNSGFDFARVSGTRLFEIRFRHGSDNTAQSLARLRPRVMNTPMLIDVSSPAEIAPAVEFFRSAVRKPA